MSEQDIDAHLCAAGTVVAASDRAARAVLAAFHRARLAEGLEAWASPRVYDWQTFVRMAWQERTLDGRLVLNAAQEQSLWERIIAESGHVAALLEGPRRNLAAMAMHAHALLCSHAPQFLDAKARNAWEQDSAAFSHWLSAFEETCRKQDVISPSRLPLELLSLLQSDSEPRPELLLVGFDRLLPAQASLLETWGQWSNVIPGEQPGTPRTFIAADQAEELSACAEWCSQQVQSAPHRRILIVAQDVQMRRGELERAFLRHAASDPSFRVEFSLGVLLAQTAPVRSAHMLLRWLGGELAEHELDCLTSSQYAASAPESAALQATMRALRRLGMQRTHWKLSAFLDQRLTAAPLPEPWVQRLKAAHARLQDLARSELTPTEWADTVPQLLEVIGWPGENALTSAEFQVIRRWRQVLDSCGSLGFGGRQMNWQEFLSELLHAADETLFAPESEDAPILIAGPAESAGLTADAIWFLGAHEDAWPARGDTHPLIPIDVQRRSQMPHAIAQLDWNVAHSMTARLVASAREVNFSYARQADGVDLRASRLITQFAGTPQPLPPDLIALARACDISLPVEDVAAIAYRTPPDNASIHLRGGAALLTAQSNCAFKAFATGRLDARTWDLAEVGLTAAERGNILHEALHSVWSGPPNGIRSSRELHAIADLPEFVRPHVQAAMSEVPARIREDMPPQYLELEATRLTRVISEWLAYEQSRVEFEVVGAEIDKTLTIAGLSLKLRLDRLDRLNDGSLLVIDYKSGNVSPRAWDLPRPEDIQLPLYASFGIDEGEAVGGLAFAKVRAGDMCFAGKIGNAAGTVDRTLKSPSSLVKFPLELDELEAWRTKIDQLARDFLAGRADVNPLDVSKTCERCGLQTLCRINERTVTIEEEEAEPAHD